MIVYPAIDIKQGKCARLKQGDMDRSKEYGDPVEMALRWQAAGAKYLHVVDLDAAFEGRFVNGDVVKRIVKSLQIPVEMGGGVRTKDDIRERIEEAGVARVILGTAACEDLDLVKWAVRTYGGMRVAVGIDVTDGKVVTRGWAESTDLDPIDFALQLKAVGVNTIIYTETDRDGMMEGPAIAKIEHMVKSTWLHIIGSGGIRNAADVRAVRDTGATGVIIGTALYEGTITVEEALKAAK